ncbi:hypothetical protein [Algisphaera agarilytica]|uniref:DUF4175 domain-containing protein n=1 Tax=Algisphaera agarilytica TaxID=1385975 RepID=A0A7X0H5Q2_9BACT|nr:hypothetical protein [Algisphaera agarilytica]MBB6429628.1 hypothetical protein [Algisphaera agarilytica]
MQHIARQLEQVRRRGRVLLVLQRLAQAVAVVLPVLIVLGVVDFGLRLPGWMRGVIGLVLLALGLSWLVRRLTAAWRFGPSLSALALRVEAMVPHLSGLLTSSLEFGLAPERYASPASTAAMAQATVAKAEQELAGVRVGQIVNLEPTRKRAMWLVGAVALFGIVAASAPTHSAIAASRWLMPWSDTAWPKRTQVSGGELPAAAAIDSPVEFSASVGRGFRPGMRVWLNLQSVDVQGQPTGALSPQRLLMTEQLISANVEETDSETPGEFKLQWRAPADLVRQVSSGDAASAKVQAWFEAGDDLTEPQVLTLVARPALQSVVAEVEPPAYAAGLAAPQTVALHEQSQRIASVTMLAGAQVQLTLGLNKPLPAEALEPEVLVPGLVSIPDLVIDQLDPRSVVLGFTLNETTQTPITLTDAHGLTQATERLVRFEALEDRQPAVTILEPSADASVLATALLPVSAQASDDVGIRALTMHAEHPDRVEVEDAVDPNQPGKRLPLAEEVARSEQLAAEATLDLSTLPLRVGDVVTVHASAQDVFELNGFRHDTAQATPRRLNIIDPNTLIDQVRADLAGVRQQAQRLELQQEQLIKRLEDDNPARLQSEQARVTRAVESQRQQLSRVQDRLRLNRLNDATLDELIRQADALAEQAQQASEQAQEDLQDAAEAQSSGDAEDAGDSDAQQAKAEASQQQAEARERLEDLAKLLDQGRDALGLKLELARLKAEQEALAQDTRELLPRTAGQPMDQLSEEMQQALQELAERQEALAEQAQDAVERLQSSAESLAQQGESDQDRAAAEAMAEAAAVAQRQGLGQQMSQAQQGLEQNQLSQAGSSQMQSLDTLDQMMQQLGEQDELRQELLRRRLLALEEQLRRLIEGQTLANVALEATPADASVEELANLAPDQSNLWVRTIAVQTEAEADQETAEIAPIVAKAVEAQAAALTGLRGGGREDAQAGQRVALERLEEALAKVQEKQAENEQDQTQQERDELRQKYLELAQQQKELNSETAELLKEVPLSRKTRAALRGLAKSQNEIGDAAAELGNKVAKTVVFQKTHEMIDTASGEAAGKLSRGQGDSRVLRQQRQTALLLETMAEALDQSGGPQEFAEGGSSSGGGGGGPQPLIPPAAELKLLRGVQQSVYDETRALADTVRTQPTDEQAELLTDLSGQQRELSGLGQRLIQQMQQQQQPGAPAP